MSVATAYSVRPIAKDELDRVNLRCYPEDRAAMAVSLETRIPFLDPDVISFAWSLPMHMKCNGGLGKLIVRDVLYRYVPKELIERPKAGFAIPVAQWIRGPLKKWAEELIDPSRLQEEGFFDPQVIHRKWEMHQSGSRNWQNDLWAILMFQRWLEHSEIKSI